jgi:hypothetical protein
MRKSKGLLSHIERRQPCLFEPRAHSFFICGHPDPHGFFVCRCIAPRTVAICRAALQNATAEREPAVEAFWLP